MYGLNTLHLNETQLNQIKRIEGNLIKHIIGISTKSKSTGLLSALKIDLTIDNIKKQKLNSFLRLINNEYIKEFIIQLYDLKTTSFVTDIQELTFKSDTNINELIRNSKIRIRELEEIQTLNSKSEETKSIKNAFHIKDPKERTKQLSLRTNCIINKM